MVTAQDLLQKRYISIDINDTVSQLLGKLRRARAHAAIVFKNGTYMGVVTKRFLLTSKMDPSTMKVSNIVKHRSKSKAPFYVPTLKKDADVRTMCRLFATADSHILPVMDGKNVLGVIYAKDLIKELRAAYRGLRCDELASMNPIVIKENAGLDTALRSFTRKGIDRLPVVDSDGKLTGLLTMSDIIDNNLIWSAKRQRLSRAASHQGNKLRGYGSGEKTRMTNLPITNYVTLKNICCTSPTTTLPKAILMMADNDVSSLVLVKNNEPVGILTVKDFFKDYAK